MGNLYIRIENGQPISHPVTEENMKMFFSNIDPENPPADFERFERVPPPELGPDEVYEESKYEISNYYTDLYKTRTWTDVHYVRKMTKEEELNIVEKFKGANGNLKDWVYDEEKKLLLPPIPKPKPKDGKDYLWIENGQQWVEVPKNVDFDKMVDVAADMGIDLGDPMHIPMITADVLKKILAKMEETP